MPPVRTTHKLKRTKNKRINKGKNKQIKRGKRDVLEPEQWKQERIREQGPTQAKQRFWTWQSKATYPNHIAINKRREQGEGLTASLITFCSFGASFTKPMRRMRRATDSTYRVEMKRINIQRPAAPSFGLIFLPLLLFFSIACGLGREGKREKK